LTRTLQAAQVTRVWRRAKLIVLDFVGATDRLHLVVQPRFTGGLLIARDAPAADVGQYVCITLDLTDGRQLHYRDVRRLGTVALMSAERFAAYAGALGPEPLDQSLTDAEFSVLLRSSKQAVKVALMDQGRLAGIGNIYANEALWLSGIDPSREARSVGAAEAAALLAALRDVLTRSIAARGTSFRDYRDARGERGGFVEQLAAYGRAGQPCHRCGRRLVGTHAIDGRTTVFCPTCQH
jgi:formamidopyrimidine-DNA glycosylase